MAQRFFHGPHSFSSAELLKSYSLNNPLPEMTQVAPFFVSLQLNTVHPGNQSLFQVAFIRKAPHADPPFQTKKHLPNQVFMVKA
jgi:hypothetical protein